MYVLNYKHLYFNKQWFIYFLLQFVTLNLIAQNNTPLKFNHLTIDQGLSSNRVYSILQDSEGFMWIGTSNGLNRYDGYQVKHYYYDAENPYSINSNEVYTLFEDSDFNLWVGTIGEGLCKYDREKDRFIRYSEFNKQSIRNIIEDEEKNLWIFGEGAFSRIDKKTNKIQKFNEKYPIKRIQTACRASQPNEFWLGTAEDGLYLVNVKTNTFKHYTYDKNKPHSLSSNNILKVYLDKKGLLWIGTIDAGVDFLNPQTEIFTNYRHEENNLNSLPINRAQAFLEVEGKLWIGTENGGLSVFDPLQKIFTNYQYEAENLHSISSNMISAGQGSLYIDKQGRILVCTGFGGVNIIDKYYEKIAKLSIPLTNSTVNAIIVDSKKRLWIGTEGNLVKVENDKTFSYFNFPVLSIAEDKNGVVWVGTWLNGLQFYDEKSDKFIKIKHDPNNKNSLGADNVTWIQQSKDNETLYIGTTAGISTMSSKNTQYFTNYKESNCSQKIDFFYGLQILEEKPNDIWVVSFNALLHYDLKKGETLCYQNATTNPNSISSSKINTIYKDSKGRYWIGTNEGLNLMQKEGIFKRITTKNGLPNDAIKGILEDEQGNLWLSTNKGLSKFNPDENTFQNFDIMDGLQSDEFIRKAAFKDRNGYLYFGGVKGLNIFHPDSIKNNTYKPPVHIIGLKIFNKPVKLGDYDSLLHSEISRTKEITLSYQQSVFTLDFVGVNFTHSEKNQYAYILEGFEKEWNYVGNQRNATYTNLDAGTYTFRVKASNNDGLWNEEGTSIKIIILPPWWETWWFRVISISLFLGSGVAFYIIRMNALQKQNQKLEKTVAERTQELSQANEILKAQTLELQISKEEITTQNEEIIAQNEELQQSQEEVSTLNNHLEALVVQRTQKLTQSNQKLNEYAFFNAHKLRAPIATTLGLYELLKLDISLIEREMIFEKIKESIVLLDEMVKRSQRLLDEERE